MAITIYDYHKNQLASGGNDGSVISGDFGTRVAGAFYIDYTKGNEKDLKITFDAYFKYVDAWYPISYDTQDSSITPISKTLSESGKYRIEIPVFANETIIRINAVLEDITDSSKAGTANIMIAPVITSI